MPDINKMAPRSGRVIKEDGTYVNVAEGYDEDGTQRVKLTGSYVEHRGMSSDTKPIGENVGDTFFEIDTQDVYMWDGTQWRLI